MTTVDTVRAAQPVLDQLTGFLTRQSLNVILQAQAIRENMTDLAFLAIEMSRFGLLNASLGSETADRIIATIARRMARLFPNATAIARLHGDHFGVVFAQSADIDAQVRRLLEFAERPMAIDGEVTVLNIRVGVATGKMGLESPQELVQAAEAALYQSKTQMTKIAYFETDMLETARSAHALENDLRVSLVTNSPDLHRALANDEFELNFQPIVDSSSGQIHAFEALLRWQHPRRGMVPPSAFIPLAEQIHVMNVLGQWVLRRAMAEAMTWKAGPDGTVPKVSVNLSVVQFDEPDVLVAAVQTALIESGLPGERLNLEITESAQFSPVIRPHLDRLLLLGCTIALDDFGTGYGSISELASLPIHYVKLDRSLVRDVADIDEPRANRARKIVAASLSLADSLGVKAVIEGIETPAGLAAVRALGGQLIQGFVYAKPMPAENVNDFIRSQPLGGQNQ